MNYQREAVYLLQVVWVGSKQMGAGVAKSNSGRTYVVAKYLPAGNMMGDFPANVKPPGSKEQVSDDVDGVLNNNHASDSNSKKSISSTTKQQPIATTATGKLEMGHPHGSSKGLFLIM